MWWEGSLIHQPELTARPGFLVAQRVKNAGDTSSTPGLERSVKWQRTPVFLPEKPHRERNLAGYGPWNSKESDTTEQLNNNTARPTKGRGLRVAWRCPKMPYWNGAAPYSPCPPTMSSACLLPVKNFSQRISLIRNMKNIETKKTV